MIESWPTSCLIILYISRSALALGFLTLDVLNVITIEVVKVEDLH